QRDQHALLAPDRLAYEDHEAGQNGQKKSGFKHISHVGGPPAGMLAAAPRAVKLSSPSGGGFGLTALSGVSILARLLKSALFLESLTEVVDMIVRVSEIPDEGLRIEG